MALAFAEALKVKGRTLPNPPVGAVLVKNGRVVGKGGTRPAGQAHAEIVALEKAGENARGATLYVTLEPCRHFGRTPPCTRALIAAGVKRVVAACIDPNSLMAGKSLSELRRAGVAAESGLLAERGEEFYEGFFFFIRHGRPKIVLKIAQSLDGRINARPGVETKITGRAAQRFVHALRSRADAVLICGRTLRVDNPCLTPRLAGGAVPEALVLTRRRKFGPLHLFDKNRIAKTTLLSTALIRSLLDVFRQKGYHLVLVEGGRSVWRPFLNAGLCDQLCLLTASKLFPKGERWNENLRPSWVESLEFHRFTSLGRDVLAEFRRA